MMKMVTHCHVIKTSTLKAISKMKNAVKDKKLNSKKDDIHIEAESTWLNPGIKT